MRVVEAGYLSNSSLARVGLATNRPLQLGHWWCSVCSVHSLQNVHSNEQINASSELGGRSQSQRSQFGRSSSINHLPKGCPKID